MTEPAVLTCPRCGAPTSFQAPFCTHCRGPLTWGAVPLLSRGKLLARCDATREALPAVGPIHARAVERSAEGTLVTVGPGRAVDGQLGPRRRHGCIVVDVVALDPNAGIGAYGRQQEASASGGYSLVVVPRFRSVNLARVLATTTKVHHAALHAYEFQRCVRPVGHPNEVELRCADSLLNVFVNGQHVAACVDATFGFGGFCWRVQSLDDKPARSLIRSVALYDVA